MHKSAYLTLNVYFYQKFHCVFQVVSRHFKKITEIDSTEKFKLFKIFTAWPKKKIRMNVYKKKKNPNILVRDLADELDLL